MGSMLGGGWKGWTVIRGLEGSNEVENPMGLG